VLILGLALALFVGLSLGLLGGGGSILTVPILVYVVGFETKASIAMSLAVVGTTSLVGAIRHWQVGNLNVRVAVVFGPVAMVGTYLGARLSVFFSGSVQLVLFAIVMLTAAVYMFRDRQMTAGSRETFIAHPVALLMVVVAEALVVGVLTGLVGVSGGFLIVPALLLLGLSMKEAVGTSLVVVTLKSFAGFVGYLPHVEVEWAFIAEFTAVAIVGIWIGALIVRSASQKVLRRAFAILLIVMAIAILYQNRAVF
jgi:uncharacterized membrane protein YfcA